MELYMLQPVNKSDRMCHLVAMTACSCDAILASMTREREVMPAQDMQLCVHGNKLFLSHDYSIPAS